MSVRFGETFSLSTRLAPRFKLPTALAQPLEVQSDTATGKASIQGDQFILDVQGPTVAEKSIVLTTLLAALNLKSQGLTQCLARFIKPNYVTTILLPSGDTLPVGQEIEWFKTAVNRDYQSVCEGGDEWFQRSRATFHQKVSTQMHGLIGAIDWTAKLESPLTLFTQGKTRMLQFQAENRNLQTEHTLLKQVIENLPVQKKAFDLATHALKASVGNMALVPVETFSKFTNCFETLQSAFEILHQAGILSHSSTLDRTLLSLKAYFAQPAPLLPLTTVPLLIEDAKALELLRTLHPIHRDFLINEVESRIKRLALAGGQIGNYQVNTEVTRELNAAKDVERLGNQKHPLREVNLFLNPINDLSVGYEMTYRANPCPNSQSSQVILDFTLHTLGKREKLAILGMCQQFLAMFAETFTNIPGLLLAHRSS